MYFSLLYYKNTKQKEITRNYNTCLTKIKLAYTEISSFGKIGNKLLSQPLHTTLCTLRLQKFPRRGQKKNSKWDPQVPT